MEFVLKTGLKHRLRRIFIVGMAGSVFLNVAVSAEETVVAEEKSPSTADVTHASGRLSSADKKSGKGDVGPDDRDAAMKFASEHHPELARLLEQLQKSRPSEFNRAIRELGQQIQVLERSREKNPARYQTQLQVWKQDSQIRVLMARWSYSHDPKLEQQIRELLKQRQEGRRAQLEAEKVRLAEQQRRVDEQLAAMMQPVEERIDQEWEQLSKKARTRKSAVKKNSELPSAAAKK